MGFGNSKVEEMSNINSKIPDFILSASKSVVKLNSQNKTFNGFLIKFFKDDKDFFCLLTVEECLSKDMIERTEDIKFYYDNESKLKKISLNKKERFIKNFNDMGINSTVIEITPKDEISKDYFLLPVINYTDEFNELKNEEIFIIHFPKGILNFSPGIIKDINKNEFTLSMNNEINALGNPIFLKGGSKVIGIKQKNNKANFIGPIFNYLLNYQENNSNEQTNITNIPKTTNKNHQNNNLEINYKNSKKENGIIKYDNGEYYKGEEKNGKRQGKGILYNKNGGIKYEGEWNNDYPDGNGKCLEEQGNYYIGEFKKGIKHGKGKYYDKSGNLIYEGDFADGKKEGTGKLINKDGSYYEGDFKNDCKHGKGKLFNINGCIIYDGEFSNNLPNGYGNFYFDDGTGNYYEGQF